MRWCLLLAVLVAMAAAGCSSSGAAAVEGTVSYDGSPIDVGTITFIPKASGKAKTGGLIDNGAYRIDETTGPSPGSQRVEIRWARPTGKKTRNEYGEEIQVRQEGLPEKYHNQSALTAEIVAGKNVVNFALEK